MSKKIMACVTIQLTCHRLIEYASTLANETGGELFVVHVAKKGAELLGNSDAGAATDYLFETTRQFGGEMTILRSSDVFATLSAFIKEHHINTVVLGTPGKQSMDSGLLSHLKQNFPHVEFLVPAE